MYPLPGTPICHHTFISQCREVARNLGLNNAQRMHEFADTQFSLVLDQQQATQARVIG